MIVAACIMIVSGAIGSCAGAVRDFFQHSGLRLAAAAAVVRAMRAEEDAVDAPAEALHLTHQPRVDALQFARSEEHTSELQSH